MSGAIEALLATDPAAGATLADGDSVSWLRDRLADALHDVWQALERGGAVSESHQLAEQARSAVDDLLDRTGLTDKGTALRMAQRAQGRGASAARRRFEDRGTETIKAAVLPGCRARGHDPRLLQGVTLEGSGTG